MVLMQEEQLFKTVEEELAAILLRARQMLLLRAKAIHPDLQDPGYRLLALVVRTEPQQQGALAEQLRLDKATISRLVQHLEGLGLVTRTQDPSDGRAQLVSTTKAAREKWSSSGDVLRKGLHRHLNEWDESELKTFGALLHKLNQSIDDVL